MGRWKGEKHAAEHVETALQARERYRQERLWRPDVPSLVVLNHLERDAARNVYQDLEAVMKVEYEKRTGTWFDGGLNSGGVVDRIILAINEDRVRQASENLVNLR